MITIISPMLKLAQVKPWQFSPEEMEELEEITPRKPWEFSPEEAEELEEIVPKEEPEELIFEPVEDEDFIKPKDVIPPRKTITPEEEEEFRIKPSMDYTFLPFAPGPGEGKMPLDPSQFIGSEIPIPKTEEEKANEVLDLREKIFYSLNNGIPMKITYRTLDGKNVTDRIIHPDYVYWAGTNRHILVAWDELKNDWRAFAVDNINEENASLLGRAEWLKTRSQNA